MKILRERQALNIFIMRQSRSQKLYNCINAFNAMWVGEAENIQIWPHGRMVNLIEHMSTHFRMRHVRSPANSNESPIILRE